MVERLLKHVVQNCPLCQDGHEYVLVVRGEESAPLLFGGPEATGTAVSCPVTGDMFTISPHLREGEKVVAIRPADIQQSQPGPIDEDFEYSEWLKTSRATALDFGKTMLTTSAGAVAIYFAILKYLGLEKASHSLLGWVSVIPPSLFLVSIAAFGWGLRPTLAAVSEADFPTFRENRLRRLNRSFTTGTVLFILALALSAAIFAGALLQR